MCSFAAVRVTGPKFINVLLPVAWLAAAGSAQAQVAEPGPRAEDAFDFMNLLARHDLHDLQHERWNAYGQVTWISSFKPPFPAAYTNLHGSTNSLLPSFEHSFTATATLYAGVALWPGAEIQWVPEMISERPLSHLAGLGGVIQNFELQKTGGTAPSFYRSRIYIKQTVNLGGSDMLLPSDPMQLGTTVKSHRLVLVLGNFSVLDFFDKNSFAGDLRRQFFNMAFLTHAAYDFAADARGYTWGAMITYHHGDWALRAARVVPPVHPNQLALETRFWLHYGDQLELEHIHTWGHAPGAVRFLVYRNQENMADFDAARAAYRNDPGKNATTCVGFTYGSHNQGAPDVCWARRTQTKMGVGFNVEQAVGPGLGVFFRAMVSDGRTEVYSYTSTDRSVSVGLLGNGAAWGRAVDILGLGFAQGWISEPHAAYLRAGGVDGFLGDGALRQAPERVWEVFYSLNVVTSVWLSADYQHISNPGYNADRGPVNILGVRAHAEL